MKFVNKLSVIGLIVLMFSFMNVAQAAGVKGCPKNDALNDCSLINKVKGDDNKKAWECNNSFMRYTDGKFQACKWTKVLVVKIHNHDNSTAEAEAEWTCNDSGGQCNYEGWK
jgi:hypothetical protein